MRVMKGLLWPFQTWNDLVLPVGRWIAILAIALMVAVTLLQVFCRYVLNSALPWPDEAARFMMLWLTGLIAPRAYRRGGFVAIDTIPRLLPRVPAATLSLILLLFAGLVLFYGIRIGWAEVTGFGGRFDTAALYLPLPGEWFRIPRSWMMASLLVGFVLLFVVNVELVLRNLLTLMGARDLRPLALAEEELMAE